MPRPWSKYSEGSSAHTEYLKKKEAKEKKKKAGQKKETETEEGPAVKKRKIEPQVIQKIQLAENDPEFQKFLEIVKPTQHSKQPWKNDLVENAGD